MPAQVSVPRSGRSWWTVWRAIRRTGGAPARGVSDDDAAAAKMSGRPRMGDENGHAGPMTTRAKKTRKGASELQPAHAGRGLGQLLERHLQVGRLGPPAQDEDRGEAGDAGTEQKRPEEPDIGHVDAGRRHHGPQADRRRRRAEAGDDEDDGRRLGFGMPM